MDPIDRSAAIDALCSVCGVDCDKSKFVYGGKQEDQVILCPEHYVLTQLPSAQPDSELVTWLLDWIWDEGQWELNWQAFPELLCRKLVTFGYLREKDGEYER